MFQGVRVRQADATRVDLGALTQLVVEIELANQLIYPQSGPARTRLR